MHWSVSFALMVVTSMCAGTEVKPNHEDDRACWQDDDCNRYPLCRTRTLACRCQTRGICLLARGFQQRCLEDTHCATTMVCGEDDLCSCMEGYRYSKFLNQCTIAPHRIDPPRFADLPNEEDLDSPAQIPATYGGPLLVGVIGLGLVVLCLGTALWCRCTAPTSPIRQSPSNYCRDAEREKIPLDLFYVPPPARYQTPGFHNYRSMGESSLPSTSREGE